MWLQLSLQVWTKKIQDMLNSRRQGDRAFCEKDYEQAIDCYSQVSPFLYPILVMQYHRLDASKLSIKVLVTS
jgi:hypothetical protein